MRKQTWMWKGLVAASVVFSGTSSTWAIVLDTGNSPQTPIVSPTHVVSMPTSSSPTGYSLIETQTSYLSTFNIVINPGAGLAGNAPALAAFNRAALQWESRIADPIVVTFDADLVDLGSGNVLGSASPVQLFGGYDGIRNLLVADAANEADDGIVASLPTSAQVSFSLPIGIEVTGNLSATKANLKALGVTGLDDQFGVTDATIEFNSNSSFDFDNSDGVGAGQIDFETVAAHEIGHALGFISRVDTIDALVDANQTGDISPTTLDLFRFEDNTASDPTSAAEFTANPRSLVPGATGIFDQIDGSFGGDVEVLFATGTTQGDGRQASHWKDGLGLGLLDPTLSPGTVTPISENDLRALDLIGYDIFVIPEPSTAVLLLVVGSGLLLRRRRATI